MERSSAEKSSRPLRSPGGAWQLGDQLKTQHEEEAHAAAAVEDAPPIFATPFVCPPPGYCMELGPGEEPPCDVCPTMHAARAELARSGDDISPSHRAWLLHCAQLDREPRS